MSPFLLTLRVIAIFGSALIAGAQTRPDEQKRADEAVHAVVSALGGAGPIVKDKPYSAEAVTETVQVLASGNRIARNNVTKHYRDGMGRTRREQTITTLGPSSPIFAQVIVISDPITQTDYLLDPQRLTARKFGRFEVVPALENGQRPFVKVDLGTRTIDGLECVGTRRTVTIPTGQIGNERAIEVVTESWYSATIEAIVRSTSTDPRFGETAYSLRNIVLAEPPRHFFAMPPEYKVEFEGRPGVMMKRAERPR